MTDLSADRRRTSDDRASPRAYLSSLLFSFPLRSLPALLFFSSSLPLFSCYVLSSSLLSSTLLLSRLVTLFSLFVCLFPSLLLSSLFLPSLLLYLSLLLLYLPLPLLSSTYLCLSSALLSCPLLFSLLICSACTSRHLHHARLFSVG